MRFRHLFNEASCLPAASTWRGSFRETLMNSTSKIVAAMLFFFVWIGTAFGQGSATGDVHVIVKDERAAS